MRASSPAPSPAPAGDEAELTGAASNRDIDADDRPRAGARGRAGHREGLGPEDPRVRASAGGVLHRRRGRDARRAADGTARGEDRPAARDGRGARRHPARADAVRRDAAGGPARGLPARRHPLHRGRGQPRADLLHVPRRARDRHRAAQGPDLADGRDLQHRRGDPDDRRPRGGAARSTSSSGPTTAFTAFALFMGVSMSITAFPVLARILVERRMLKRPLGVIALTSAAIDDISAWFLIALATAVAVAGSGTRGRPHDRARRCVRRRHGVRHAQAAGARVHCLRRGGARARRVDRRDLRRRAAVGVRDRADRHRAHLRRVRHGRGHAAPRGPHRGRHAPRSRTSSSCCCCRCSSASPACARTSLLLDRSELLLLTVVLTVVAIACKFGGTLLASRVTGLGWRESAVIGDADEHARPDRADRAQPRAREGRDQRGAVRDVGDHGPGDDVHGGAAAEPARPEQPVRRAGRGGARGGAPGEPGDLDDRDPRPRDPGRAPVRRHARPSWLPWPDRSRGRRPRAS